MICDHCGEEKENVEYLPDPYEREINDLIKESYWCQECYDCCAEEI